MLSNHERVGKSLNLLATALYPYIQQEMKVAYEYRWLDVTSNLVNEILSHPANRDSKQERNIEDLLQEDVSLQLKFIHRHWDELFKKLLSRNDRSIVNELIQTRNQWAHSQSFTTSDAIRALDSVNRLLSEIGATSAAEEVESQYHQLLRHRVDEQAKQKAKKAINSSIEGKIPDGLKPWREVITPHADVASGNYQQAEFAADLWEVFLDRGSIEYRDPKEFYGRTYLTQGLQDLLKNALLRLSGKGGDPVIELQTNFGGGKTHAMLALYHLCTGARAQDLPGMEPVFAAAGTPEPPANVNTVVLVGNKISPGQPSVKSDGTIVRTLWGEIAWQLGGKEGYEMLRAADETSTNPGDVLKDVFDRYAPCLILVDEWVAYARQLHQTADLPGGSFDTHFTFAQTLSESAKNADRTLLIASIPASDIEIGGDRGQEALIRLKNAIGRVESPWRPATAQESFEIVRRRLFQPIKDTFIERDAVVESFSRLYREHATEFPNECKEADYKRRLEAAYPIHPELFDRLYEDWSTLDRFQRTRGVLRLMAKVIHSLWDRADRNLLIMPAHLTIDESQVQTELCRYLEDNWAPILEKDVDGTNSLPLEIDRENVNLGRYSATRRVARSIFLGSAPLVGAANRGLEDRQIKLGCVQPGESPAIFGDALRKLTDRATYLYADNNNRYWIDTQPNVTRTAQDRASQIAQDPDRIQEEIVRRLRLDKAKADFTAVHIAPDSSADIPDDASNGVRLVVLPPHFSHTTKTNDSEARQEVVRILDKRGNSPRHYKNLLIFLAPDTALIAQLESEVCTYLAWDSIVKDKTKLNLNPHQAEQAENRKKSTDNTIEMLLDRAYKWLIIPEQTDPHQPIDLQELKIPEGQDSPILRASRKLIHEEYLLVNYAPSRLVGDVLTEYVWKNQDRIDLKQLWEYLASYPYMPRLKNADVLLAAAKAGVYAIEWESYFAYATGWDETKQRYKGLKYGTSQLVEITLGSTNLLVSPTATRRQIEGENPEPSGELYPVAPSNDPRANDRRTTTSWDGSSSPPVKQQPTRFYGSKNLDRLRWSRDVNQIANAIVHHFSHLDPEQVKISIDIQVDIPDGASDTLIRTVRENCQVLGFENAEFD
jgi:predicted AAA+ superfamily ATPase